MSARIGFFVVVFLSQFVRIYVAGDFFVPERFPDNGFVLAGGHHPLIVTAEGPTVVGPGPNGEVVGAMGTVRWTAGGDTFDIGHLSGGINQTFAQAASVDLSVVFGASNLAHSGW